MLFFIVIPSYILSSRKTDCKY